MDGFLVTPSGKPIRRNPIHDILKIRSGMLSCRRNFSGYKDSIAVLTHTAWAAISTSVSKVSYDFQLRRGVAVRASAFNNLPSKDCWAKMKDNNGNEILSELRNAAYKRNSRHE